MIAQFKSLIARWFFANKAARILLLAAGLWLGMLSTASARPVLNASDPLGFFTTVADKMLRNTFSFGVTNIPVYVNGQFVYSPAVNRVLQLAANVYDASTNSFYPDVFRPIFEHDASGNIFIVGYTNLSSAAGPNTVSGPSDLQLISPVDIATLAGIGPDYTPITNNGTYVNVYGVPWIVGAKKGFPNFNKFGMQTVVQVSRRLQVRRSTIPTVLNSTTFLTNQMISFGISNYLNAECWNSYSNTYPNPILITALDTISMAITNDIGAPPDYFYNFQLYSNTLVPRWPGFTNTALSAISFINPLSDVVILLTNSDFYFGSSLPGLIGFYPDMFDHGWESNLYTFPFPQFGLTTTNRLQLYMLDESNGLSHVIDYVQFAGPQTALNITETIESSNLVSLGYGVDMWSQALNIKGAPYGIVNQIAASEQPITVNNGQNYWPNDAANEAQVQGFAQFMGFVGPYPNIGPDNPIIQTFATNYIVQVPYTPVATISAYSSWQANDPLVHYLASDLAFSGRERSGISTGVQISYATVGNAISFPVFNVVNDRYQPWGIQNTNSFSQIGLNAVVENPYSRADKDPLVWSPDYWNFPTNLLSDLSYLGQVHRGTPWQTIYLKADDVLNILDSSGDANSGTNTWTAWTGDTNIADAATMAPVHDWQLSSLLISLLNTNNVTQLMSVDDPNSTDWLNALGGLMVYSNSTTYPHINFPEGVIRATTFDTYVMSSTSLQVEIIANSIAQARADQPNHHFNSVGDILLAPELTDNSPWLDSTNFNQQIFGISDVAYEAVPAQLLLRLRPDSIGAMSLTNGSVNLQFSGSDALNYEVQESTNLVHWVTIITNSPVQGSFNVAIPPAPNSSQLFYRSVLLP